MPLSLKHSRRRFLGSAAALVALGYPGLAIARSISGALPWHPHAADPPVQVRPGGWVFFTPDEVKLVSAIVDRLIPADELSPSASECGCVTYIDRQLAGPFGTSSRLYVQPPFMPGTPQQGWQAQDTPAARWRKGLAAFETALKAGGASEGFVALDDARKDAALKDLETGKLALGGGIDGRQLFNLILQNTMEGFFADPVYGGNKDMASWKMIGFPGARYDYRDHVTRHNQQYPHPPVSIMGRPEWSASKG